MQKLTNTTKDKNKSLYTHYKLITQKITPTINLKKKLLFQNITSIFKDLGPYCCDSFVNTEFLIQLFL